MGLYQIIIAILLAAFLMTPPVAAIRPRTPSFEAAMKEGLESDAQQNWDTSETELGHI